MDAQVQQMLSEGADAVCYKPFDVPNLLAALEQLTHEAKDTAGDTSGAR
jgi:CheY-like chemotaxis protein